MSDNIHIKLPDGSQKEMPKGSTALDVAKSISPRLADAAIAAKTNGDLIDLTRPLEKDTDLRILTDKDPEALGVYRHSSAHLLAAAVLELFPETKLGHGPATESGFFYDFYRPTPFTPEDLEKIEKKMQELVQQNLPYAREFLPRDEGLERFKSEGDFMKCHFIEQFTKPDEKISIYKTGKFLDFCRGPHIPSTGKIKAFKLLNIAGAYWLGDEKNPQLQRIYGTSFFSKKDLDAYLHQIEEAKKRDHRVLGKQLDLFSIQELAGPGLIFWHPKGGIIRKEMEDWMRNQYLKRGYSLVYTPHVMRKQLWQTSGHEAHYAQNMFDVMELDDAEYRLKPMNCPGHILIYKDSLKSYRDLPVRLGELGTVYRYERSGVMHGLLRVRGFTQDDAHIFCTPEQIEDEMAACLEFARDTLHDFGFDKFVTELSTWDPAQGASFVGSAEQWNLGDVISRKRSEAVEHRVHDRSRRRRLLRPEDRHQAGRRHRPPVAAFNRAVRFQPSRALRPGIRRRRRHPQTAGHGAPRAVWINRALLRRADRALRRGVSGMALASAGGGNPDRRAPCGVCEQSSSHAARRDDAHQEKASQAHVGTAAPGRPAEQSSEQSVIRVEVDARNEKMNAKIREHAMQKVPFMLVVGDKEAEAGKVNVRTRGKEKTEDMSAEEFGERIKGLMASRARTVTQRAGPRRGRQAERRAPRPPARRDHPR